MLKKIFLFLLIVSSSLLFSTAAPEKKHINETSDLRNLYFRTNLALPFYRKEKDHTHEKPKFRPFVNAALGAKLHNNFSLEIEFFYWKQKTKFLGDNSDREESNIESYGSLINAIMHPKILQQGKWQPFIGFGIGYSGNETDNTTSSLGVGGGYFGDTSNNFIYQIMLGSSYNVNSHFDIIGDLRWLDPLKFRHKTPRNDKVSDDFVEAKGKLRTIAFTIGGKFKF